MKNNESTTKISSEPVIELKQRRPKFAVPTVVVIAFVIAGLWFWRDTYAEKPETVTDNSLVSVTRGKIEKTVESTGSVAPNLEVEIKCRAGGEVVKLPFDISDTVKTGELLCQLDPTDEELDVRSMEASLAQAEAELEQARLSYQKGKLNLVTASKKAEAELASARVNAASAKAKLEREKRLMENNLSSQEEVESLESDSASAEADLSAAEVAVAELDQQELEVEGMREDVKLAEAEVKAQQIALDIQKQQLGYTTVLAPIDGVVASLDVQKGSIIASGTNDSGGTSIMTIMDLSRVFILASVDESDIGGVLTGQPARVTVDSFPDHTFTGKVVRIAVEGENDSGVVTFEVKVEVTDPEKNLLKPEMSGSVEIIQASRENALLLPVTAVNRRENDWFVKLPDGSLQKVTLGLQGLDEIEVLDGLSEGDRVVNQTDETESTWRRRGGPPMM